jgi:hypothetical protein
VHTIWVFGGAIEHLHVKAEIAHYARDHQAVSVRGLGLAVDPHLAWDGREHA